MPKHIVRLLGLIAVVLVVSLLAIQFMTAESFYRFGPYRADNVTEIASLETVYQTPAYCKDCHSERHAQWSANSHKSVTCETCHGPAKGHPEKGKLPIPSDTAKLCTLCHEAMPGRPSTQPQIQVAQHANGQSCNTCHNPHAPKIVAAAKVSGDPAAGKQRAAACASCHGDKGISPNDTWPNLAGQPAAYLAKILSAYKSGAQKDVAMTPLAKELSNADIQNLAVYYAGLSCDAPAQSKVSGDAAAGKAVAKNCAACHGETGVSSNPAWPHIAGQQPGYLVNVLKAFRAGLRKDPMMAGVTRGLSDTDIANLAAYYAGQKCRSPK
ncbi:MAG: c-type cytochrome [Betaproteobacteria bacterium]|nr:c-type cytochrome [Betaproteobacteria bacterium]MBI2959167.1 c-type cytochrome [Betaproteobacteria bacterium]